MSDLPILPGGGVITADMTLARGVLHAANDETKQIIYALARRLASIRPQQDRLRMLCDRFDRLYYAEDIHPQAGADLWMDDPSAKKAGRSHVSINVHSAYVDIPAALLSVKPIENMLATEDSEAGRSDAVAQERLYTAWKSVEDYDLKFAKANTVKSLYGLTFGRIFYDKTVAEPRPRIQIVEQPKNLWMGYKTDDYDEPEWAAYALRYEPNALVEAFGVDVIPFRQDDGTYLPLVQARDWTTQPLRPWLQLSDARIEVWDYWYRQPVWRGTKFLRMDTYNVVIAGNYIIRGPIKYPEYSGKLPFLPLFNTFIPGLPTGKPDLYDVEHILREKMEKITAGSQMIQNAIAGDFWQLVGQDATKVPAGMKPLRNEIIAPGPGNRIETITPFIAQFQLEQYLGRLDREAAAETGLNDLLLGLAPSQVLSSSRAINALVSNYEGRISIRRRLAYKWRRDVWTTVLDVWAKMDTKVRDVIGKSRAYLDIIDPSLSPRDEMETMNRASNAVSAKLWSQGRAMEAVGVDDPEMEQDRIREESTDATLWPERVQLMAQLMSALKALGEQTPPAAQQQAADQLTRGQSDLRAALGQQTPTNMPGGPGPGGAPEIMGQTPPIPGAPPEAGGAQPPFAQGPNGGATAGPGASPALLQSQIQGGKLKSRILTQEKLGRRG